MKSKKIFRNISLATVLLIMGCSNATEWIYYEDIIKYDDYYYSKSEDSVSQDDIGAQLGEVKYTTPKGSGKYEYRNGEASMLETGTIIYSCTNDEDCIIVKSDDTYIAYEKESNEITEDMLKD